MSDRGDVSEFLRCANVRIYNVLLADHHLTKKRTSSRELLRFLTKTCFN